MIATDITLSNRYELIEVLSRKAGRETFLAHDLLTKDSVIVKILRFGEDFAWDDLKLFEREAATLQNLDHPEIPKYLDSFDIDDVDYSGFALVQSYIEAPSLEEMLQQGCKFSEMEIIELADRLLDILSYLHQQCPPVIHRDIKPSNILLKNRSGNSIGEVYLVDFGSVQTVAKKEEGTITIVGSYGYMPLEQFAGRTTVASDLYSLGMTLTYLLTGIHPAELIQVDGQVELNTEVSKSFERWLLKIAHPHLDKRFDSARAAQAALTSRDGSYGSFDQLKPIDSQIKLVRDRHRLEISYFEYESVISVKNMAGLIVPCVAIAVVYGLGIILWLSLLGLCCAICSPMAQRKVYYRLIINEHYIYKQREINNTKTPFKVFEHPRSSIGLVAYNPGYEFSKCLDSRNRLVPGQTITISPHLYFYCDNIQYSFPEFPHDELLWLGKEISDFLNIELQIIYPLPKVPAAPSCGGGC